MRLCYIAKAVILDLLILLLNTYLGLVIVDPKDVLIHPDDLKNVKHHQRLMGESPKKKPIHCNKGSKL